MFFNLNFKSLLSIIAVSSTFAFTGNPTVAQTRFPTTFHCINQRDSSFVTVARRGNRQTSPIFIWKNTSWGSSYTPEKRCNIVSQRLTHAVAKNGGKLSGLWMTYGELNNYPIICYITSKRERCNAENMLLTLRLSEFGREREVLKEITNFSVRGTGNGTTREISGNQNTPEAADRFIQLGEKVDNAFNGNAENESPSTPTNSNTAPINRTSETTSPSQLAEEDMSF
jgi:hypothetical protein